MRSVTVTEVLVRPLSRFPGHQDVRRDDTRLCVILFEDRGSNQKLKLIGQIVHWLIERGKIHVTSAGKKEQEQQQGAEYYSANIDKLRGGNFAKKSLKNKEPCRSFSSGCGAK